MAKFSKIEPVNIELYERAWGRSVRSAKVMKKSSPQRRTKKLVIKNKKKGRKRKTT